MDTSFNRTMIYEMNIGGREKSKLNDVTKWKLKANDPNSLSESLPRKEIAKEHVENMSSSESQSVKKLSQIFEKQLSKKPNLEKPSSPNVTKVEPEEEKPPNPSPLWRIIQAYENIKGNTTKIPTNSDIKERDNIKTRVGKKSNKELVNQEEKSRVQAGDEVSSARSYSDVISCRKWLEIDVLISYRDDDKNLKMDKKLTSETSEIRKEVIGDDVLHKNQLKEGNNQITASTGATENSRLVKSLIRDYQKVIENNQKIESNTQERNTFIKAKNKIENFKLEENVQNPSAKDSLPKIPKLTSEENQNRENSISTNPRNCISTNTGNCISTNTGNSVSTNKFESVKDESIRTSNGTGSNTKISPAGAKDPSHEILTIHFKKKEFFKSQMLPSNESSKIEPSTRSKIIATVEAEKAVDTPKQISGANFKIGHFESSMDNHVPTDREAKSNFKLELESKLARTPRTEDITQTLKKEEIPQPPLNCEDGISGISFKHELKNYVNNMKKSSDEYEDQREVFSYKLGEKSKEEKMTGWERVDSVEFVNKNSNKQEKEAETKINLQKTERISETVKLSEESEMQPAFENPPKLPNRLSGWTNHMSNNFKEENFNQYKIIEDIISKHDEETNKSNGEKKLDENYSNHPSGIDFHKKIKPGATRIRKVHRPDIPKNFLEPPNVLSSQNIPSPDYY